MKEISGEENVATFVSQKEKNGGPGSAMLLDPLHCIRCGLCAARCPTEAVKMETFRFTEEIVFDEMEAV